jgi:uncharacterized protein (TIRG00374 family)
VSDGALPRRALLRYAGRAAVVLGVGAGGWWTAARGVAGASWHDVGAVLGAVTPGRLLALTGIWLAGLVIYSLVLSAALPGLGVRRSLLLNLSGSAVANVVPLGGAVATALNWRMVRTWGHSDRAFVAYAVLTNALDVLTKLLLPLVAVGTLVCLSLHVPAALWIAAACCAGVLAVAALAAWLFRRARGHRSPGAPRWRAASEERWQAAVRSHLQDSGGRIRDLVGASWHRLVPASIGYVAAQVVLLFFALRAVGLDAPVTVVLTAAAVERLGTLVPLTPGGTGIAEVGIIAWLVAAGEDPVAVVAGVLLYRVFLVAMEVPVGGVLLAAWAWAHRRPAGAVA